MSAFDPKRTFNLLFSFAVNAIQKRLGCLAEWAHESFYLTQNASRGHILALVLKFHDVEVSAEAAMMIPSDYPGPKDIGTHELSMRQSPRSCVPGVEGHESLTHIGHVQALSPKLGCYFWEIVQ